MKKFASMLMAFVAVCGLTVALSGCNAAPTKKADSGKKADAGKADAGKADAGKADAGKGK